MLVMLYIVILLFWWVFFNSNTPIVTVINLKSQNKITKTPLERAKLSLQKSDIISRNNPPQKSARNPREADNKYF